MRETEENVWFLDLVQQLGEEYIRSITSHA